MAALLFSAHGAAATEETANTARNGRFCSVLVGAAAPRGVSPTLAQSCSDLSRQAADAGLRLKARALGLRHQEVPIMFWYTDPEFHGEWTTVYGQHGHCDAAGYTVRPNTYWATKLSSVKGAAYCDRIRVNDGPVFDLPAPRMPGVDFANKIHVWASR
ncbi:hypothetical protein AB0B45_14810 [Nonomuraea sp. NPDC049152]|uniref:hypothetical protein n=1 Tax=Nonomuraea sp. NPDC049152 TaxID=3154350 RepID=UPI0033F1179D